MDNINSLLDFIKSKLSVNVILAFTIILHITLASDEDIAQTATEFFQHILTKGANLHLINALMSNAIIFLLSFLIVNSSFTFLSRLEEKPRYSYSEFKLETLASVRQTLIDVIMILIALKYLCAVIAHYWLDLDLFDFILGGLSETAILIFGLSLVGTVCAVIKIFINKRGYKI
ncbi:MAG: hypothetical protein FWG45_06640 [Oscillospiraceae bacterium]|nr:hypothetical protein [Oscillospiraceae bacterium]